MAKDIASATRPATVAPRFWAKVDKSGGDDACWTWTAAQNGKGYGNFGVNRSRTIGAHRAAYELVKGPIPDGLHIDHLCRNTLCVNPAHLEAVPQRINTLRGISLAAGNVKKTHCPRGHAYDEVNTYVYARTGARYCRACDRMRKAGML